MYTDISKRVGWVKFVFMGWSVLDCKDVVVVPFPNPDDPRLARVHKKGFAEEIKGASAEEVEEWARLYPGWYYRKFRKMAVLWYSTEKKVRVEVPKLRSHRSDYYAWIRYLPLPEGGYWYLLTLTLYRGVGFDNAWKNINRWTSRLLNRFRTYLKAKYRVNPTYLWVVENHQDGFPHVHVLFRMRYIQELDFKTLLSMFQSYWVDDEGKPLCAPHGVDLWYIGRNVQQVRDYVLKYLVKQHHRYWAVEELPNGMVAFRRSTSRIWLYRVKLFGMSQDIRAMLRERQRERVANRKPLEVKFYGSVSANRLHKHFYKPLGIPWGYWVSILPMVCAVEYEESVLPILVPSAFSSRGSPSDGVYDELVESF
ncbi:rolling circle replication-associated protein [Thermocrinis sp.]|jgi:hypothetical protein|uniref:rolling circle replication-associated protein n=1 Tax=Thermocrinis sp. TaxID=2024383 RepID=UPI003C742B48